MDLDPLCDRATGGTGGCAGHTLRAGFVTLDYDGAGTASVFAGTAGAVHLVLELSFTTRLQRLDADMTPRYGAAWIGLDADAARRAAAVGVGIVKAGGLRALTALQVG